MVRSGYCPALLVAVAAERVMAISWRTYSERHKVMARAQELARSGQHADHTTIIPALVHMAGFEAARVRLEEKAIRFQLDRLCAMARAVDRTSRPGAE